MDFATHITFEEAVLGSQGTFIASRASLTCWRWTKSVSVETVIGLCKACLASREAVIGSQ